MFENTTSAEKTSLTDNREHILNSLSEEIQDSIQLLQKKAPDSAITEFVNKELGLGKGEKIIKLDAILSNKLGEDISSLNVIKDAGEQDAAIEAIKVMLNGYFSDEERKDALEKLGDMLG